MKHYFLFWILLLCFCAPKSTLAQQDQPCGTSFWQEQLLKDTALLLRQEAYEKQIYQVFQHQTGTRHGAEQVQTIPVVVHIIHDNGAENISDAQVQQAIGWLNQALANQGVFDQGSGANCGIQLCFAQRTPNEAPTNGITRNQSPLTEMQLESQDLQVKNINRWKPADYLNIWVVRSICSNNYGCGIYGYANYPFAHGSTIDGIVMEAAYLTDIQKITGLAHEMGHYLGLYHSFEGGCTNNNCLLDGDRICDTPPDQSTAGVPCSNPLSTCATDTQSGPFTSDQPDMSWNFMDYGIIACFHDFTPDQSTRMNASLNGVRKSLLASKACLPPCTMNTVAAFTTGTSSVPLGVPVNFTNTSQNAGAVIWSVNGVPFSTQTNAAYTFTAPGNYTITLHVEPLNSTLCYPDEVQMNLQVFCPVDASFSLSNIYPFENEPVIITNTSMNALQTSWLVNGVPQGSNLDTLRFEMEGAYEIRLIVGNGQCADTATQFVYVQEVCLQKTFEMYIWHYGNTTENLNVSISQLTDGNFLLSQIKSVLAPDDFSPFICKLKPDGQVSWSREIGAPESFGNSIITRASPDGGFVAFWGEGNIALNTGDFFLAKFNASGQTIWLKKIPWNLLAATLTEVDMFIRADGSIVVGGLFLASFTADGDLIWVKSYGHFKRLIPYPSGGFLAISGYDIVRFDSMGEVLWRMTLETEKIIEPKDLVAMPDGRILVAGRISTNIATIWHAVLLELSPGGAVLWTKVYRQIPVSTYEFQSICLSADNQLILSGRAIADNPGPANFATYSLLLKADPQGNIIWSRHRQSTNIIQCQGILPSTGGYIVAGSAELSGTLWVLKTDDLGETRNCKESPHQVNTFDLNVIGVSNPVPESPIILEVNTSDLLVVDIEVILDTLCAPACTQSIEICDNQLDDDADGFFDCLDPDCACSEDRCSPNQANIWYFGANGGIDFNTEPPTVLAFGATACEGIAASICDVKGNLLCYTDGSFVYNRFHQSMPNGNLLMPGQARQSLIIPHPGNPAQYYVLTDATDGTIYYSLVDMTLDNGNGDILPSQLIQPLAGNASGLAAVKACSFQGYWFLTRTLESNSKFLAYRVSIGGLNPVPIVSNFGQSVSAINQLKFSPDGKYVACTYHSNSGMDSSAVSIYRFDPYLSGKVINPIMLEAYKTPNLAFGVEFSPNGLMLYVSGAHPNNVRLLQFNLESGDPGAIGASKVRLATIPGQSINFLQLAANGKIYAPTYGNVLGPPGYSLDVINKPDIPGTACQYEHEGFDNTLFYPAGGVFNGLSNAIASYFVTQQKPLLSLNAPDTICVLNTPIEYHINNVQCGIDSITWETEQLDVEIQANYQFASIRYLSPGAGRIIVTAHSPCGSATDTLEVLVVAPLNKTIDLGPDQVVCQNGVFTFNAGSGFARYLWSDNTTDSSTTTLFPGTYWVKAWDLCGNLQTDSITISIAPNSVLDLGPDLPQQCSGFSASYQRPAIFESWRWSPDVFLTCADCPTVTVSPEVSNSWTVVAQTAAGCVSVDTLRAVIRDTLLFSRDTSICAGQTLLLYGSTLPADTSAQFFLPANGAGCDTLLNINVLGVDNAASAFSVTICANAVFEYQGVSLPPDTVAVFHWPSTLACDSLVTVTVNAFPLLSLQLPMDTTIHIGASVLLEAETIGTGNLNFAWSPIDGLSCFDCPNPLASPLDTITYSLSVTDANGCSVSEKVTIRVNEACRVRIPNAFTPNGDGSNDRFRPIMDPCVKTVRSWRILNRWGQVVFEQFNFPASDPNLGWDGSWNGKAQPSDVLIWRAEFEFFDGRRESQNGEVTLLR